MIMWLVKAVTTFVPGCAALIAFTVASMVFAVTLFFRMDHITVVGNERYSEQEVLDASGLSTGSNLYFLNKFNVKETIFAQLPYVEEVKIYRKLPDTLAIEVRECTAAAGVESEDGVWLISEQGKLLEENTPEELFTHPQNPRLQDFLSKVL